MIEISLSFLFPDGAVLQEEPQNVAPAAVLRRQRHPSVIIGESELQKGVVKLREIATREETEVPREELVAKIVAKRSSQQ